MREACDADSEHIHNRAIRYGTRGFDVPYPGDGRVLWPYEVTPASTTEEEEFEEESESGG